MSKYSPLSAYLSRLPELRWSASFQAIEAVIGRRLPASASEHRTWWANHGGTMVHQAAWLSAGWRVIEVDLARRAVTFERQRVAVQPQRVRPIRSPAASEVSSLTVRVGWQPLGIGLHGERGWRLPMGPEGPGLCRLTPLAGPDGETFASPRVDIVDDIAAFLADPRTGAQPDAAPPPPMARDARVLVDVAPEKDVWIIIDGRGRKADLAHPLDRGLVHSAAVAAAWAQRG